MSCRQNNHCNALLCLTDLPKYRLGTGCKLCVVLTITFFDHIIFVPSAFFVMIIIWRIVPDSFSIILHIHTNTYIYICQQSISYYKRENCNRNFPNDNNGVVRAYKQNQLSQAILRWHMDNITYCLIWQTLTKSIVPKHFNLFPHDGSRRNIQFLLFWSHVTPLDSTSNCAQYKIRVKFAWRLPYKQFASYQ